MSTEEKRKLGAALTRLSPEDLTKALEIVAQNNPGFQATAEEVDLDIDAQSETTLWRLKFFVKDALEVQGKSAASADCGAGEEVAVNGDGQREIAGAGGELACTLHFFNLFRPLVSHSLMSSPNSRLSIQETMSSNIPSSLGPYLLQVYATISRKSKHKCSIHDDKLQYHPMHTAVVHQKAIFIRMPTEEVLPPFSFIALHNATKLSMLENSEVFLDHVTVESRPIKTGLP
ncbi:hypothetical protein D5086_015777 [Populus alba]|uniref:Uncharacterized protein n=1 Tax=Populus alba TaxID=43335 RepID=A0ACC4BST6_POPAL